LPFARQILLASYQIYAALKHFMRRSFFAGVADVEFKT